MASSWEKWKKEEYHPNFKKRALYRKKRVKFTCEMCGAKKGETYINKHGHSCKVMVAAAHVNHDPKNARAKLIILCQKCHKGYDRYDHADKARRTRSRKKQEAMLQAGQLELFKKAKQIKVSA